MFDGRFTRPVRAMLAAGAFLALGWSVAPGWAVEPVAQADTDLAERFDEALPKFQPAAEPAGDLAEPDADSGEDAAQDWTQYGSGMASYYAARFDGRRTASGERFDNDELTAAHRTLPFGTRVKVSRNGHSVVVRINDRGPFTRSRVIDVSQAAARELGLIGPGHGQVTLAVLDGDDDA